jgi:hypothetical protein
VDALPWPLPDFLDAPESPRVPFMAIMSSLLNLWPDALLAVDPSSTSSFAQPVVPPPTTSWPPPVARQTSAYCVSCLLDPGTRHTITNFPTFNVRTSSIMTGTEQSTSNMPRLDGAYDCTPVRLTSFGGAGPAAEL